MHKNASTTDTLNIIRICFYGDELIRENKNVRIFVCFRAETRSDCEWERVRWRWPACRPSARRPRRGAEGERGGERGGAARGTIGAMGDPSNLALEWLNERGTQETAYDTYTNGTTKNPSGYLVSMGTAHVLGHVVFVDVFRTLRLKRNNCLPSERPNICFQLGSPRVGRRRRRWLHRHSALPKIDVY